MKLTLWQQKYELKLKIHPVRWDFFVINLFKHRVMPHVDAFLGLRSSLVGYQYSEALLAMTRNFFSGGDQQMEVLSMPFDGLGGEIPHCAAAEQAGRNPTRLLRGGSERRDILTLYIPDEASVTLYVDYG